MKSNRIDFYEWAASLAESVDSLYDEKQVSRVHIYEFMELNEWFGIGCSNSLEKEQMTLRKKKWMISDTQARMLEQPLRLWLRAYQRTHKEKLDILMEYGSQIWPETVHSYEKFMGKSDEKEYPTAWKLLDYLLASLEKELAFYSQEETEILIRQMSEELSLSSAKLFSGFLEFIRRKGKGQNWIYKFNARKRKEDEEKSAYSMKDFAVMAYVIFNEEAWKELNLVEKACESETYANLWAFLAMHFVCGMRGTDIVRIPIMQLPFSGEKMRDQIQKGLFQNAETITEELQIRIKYKHMTPNKTRAYSSVPEIKVFIPQSLQRPMGLILALAASFHSEQKVGDPFLKISRDIIPIRNFFGNEFVRALGGRSFSTRRANKSYLQGISMISEISEQNAPKGYMLAALARSHKGGIGTLPEMTDIYLKDAAFGGYSPEFIAREMFERGVFGFIPYLLLKMYAKESYTQLPISIQTDMIKKLGIGAQKVENTVRLIEKSFFNAETTIQTIMESGGNVEKMIQHIASGVAQGKQRECLCILSAAGLPCSTPEKADCIGCRFEIYTKTTMHLMVREYMRMKEKMTDEEEGWRYQKLLKQGVLPVITEILASVKKLYPNADMDMFSEIMEGGLRGMLIAVNERIEENYSRYMMVNELDEENIEKAKEVFKNYHSQRILLNNRFSDPVWRITDEKTIKNIRFDYPETLYYSNAREWIGCSYSCFQDAVRAYLAFQLGSLVIDSLCDVANQFRKLASSEAEQVLLWKKGSIHVVNLLKMIPEGTQMRDSVLEEMEEKLTASYVRRKNSKQRCLADFQSYFRFHEALEKYWKRAEEKDRLFFFPVYLWWNLTAVLPLRPTEFLLTPRDCLEEKDGENWITVRRTMLKGGTQKVGYCIEKDYEKKSYPITERLAEQIRWYCDKTKEQHFEIGTLFSTDIYNSINIVAERKECHYFTYGNLYDCLRVFYRTVLKDTDISVIQLGDTRHIAMMNLIISGGSPVICKELAGHTDIDISSHYYSNMTTLVECATLEVYRRSRQKGRASATGTSSYDIGSTVELVRLAGGWCRSEKMKEQKIEDCLKSVDSNGEIGNCDSCGFFRPDCQGMQLKLWDVDAGKKQVQADSWYLMHMVEAVRKAAGYEEDIRSAIMKLQSSCSHYRNCLLKAYEEET